VSSDLTRARQQNEVGEGLAVGCLVAGVNAVSATAPLDGALAHALRSWPWAARYPAMCRSPRLSEVLRRGPGRQAPRVAHWVTSQGLFVPQLRDDEWDLSRACVTLEEATSVPARRWVDLAGAFVDGLDGASVWRGAPVDPLEGP
jgi:hypothetical protein